MRLACGLLLALVPSLPPHILPGFRMEKIADVPGFASSIVVDSQGTIYATSTSGWVVRIEGSQAVSVTALPTKASENGGLLGMALLDDDTAVVHYTTWLGTQVLDDVIATVDLTTGAERVLRAFPGDIELRERGVNGEHHGGNPTVAPDGSIFVGIGEYGVQAPAQDPEWNGGKIWRLDRDGNATQFAIGMRNPFDLAWDPLLDRPVVSDNGPQAGDEIHVIAAGANCGWPVTYGNQPPMEGATAPVYVFPTTVAPTGLLRLSGANPLLRRGFVTAAFVTEALYYFPDLAAQPVPAPVPIVQDFGAYVMDVAEGPAGEIYVATAFNGASEIHRLHVPPRGDCNGDGLTDVRDIVPLIHELHDGESHPMTTAQDGEYRGSWGCDANADGLIDSRDLDVLAQMVSSRRRVVRK